MRLENKVAILTGIGAGIGQAAALRFAEEGARLVLADLNEEAAARTARMVEEMGGKALAIRADISVESDAKAISEAAAKAYGTIDILVNNAAEFTAKSVENATLEDWHRVYGVNVFGTAMVSKYAIPYMKAHRRGSIVNVGSVSGVLAQKDFATYSSTKGAIITMSKCMALDLAPYGIRVNTVCPGTIVTSASEREWKRVGLTKEEWCAKEAPRHILNRTGEAREVANVILFVASDEASFMTASEVMVEGGSSSW
jgi:NAD(P)-dependent dehydrogenase (short-subunit alcohol dehydrogenase family)